MAKRINVSLPHEDIGFCKSRNLSPSKLLQERITQIRDEQNPILQANLVDERKRVDNLSRKNGYLQNYILKLSKALSKEIGADKYDKIIEKI